MTRIGINGFGRIGRTLCRAAWAADRAGDGLSVVAVNDIQPVDQLAYLLEHDSVAGRLPGGLVVDGRCITSGDGQHSLRVLTCDQPEDIPWADLGVDVVIESSRRFADGDQARRHLGSGAPVVIVSAPSDGADATFVVGVNDHEFDRAKHRVVSNASCTTNCLAPMAKVLDEAFGIEDGLMTTVHAFTSDQALVDGAGGAFRHARAATTNIVPSASGAARATRFVLPDLAGRLDGAALRVPVPDGSITDLTVAVRRTASRDDVLDAFRAAATDGPLREVLEYSEAPLVSSDIIGNPASCVFDAPLTAVSGRLVKVFGWYDNEWGYSNPLLDLAIRTSRSARDFPQQS